MNVLDVFCSWCDHTIGVPILTTEVSWQPSGPLLLVRRPCCGRDVAVPVSEMWAYAWSVAHGRALDEAEAEVDEQCAEFACLLDRTDFLASLAGEVDE
jgi:hypothetical protein